MYRLFYNYESTGDVLFVVLDQEAYPDETKQVGDVTALYKEGKLIGINLFHFGKTVKIKAKGMIITPENVLIDVINSLLSAAGIETLPYVTDSGYVCAKVEAVEEHPLDERARILTLNAGDKTLTTVSRYQYFGVNDIIVVAKDGCIKFDGTVFHSRVVKNIPVECEVCCQADLRLGEEYKAAYLPADRKAGDDFFLA